MPNHQVRQQILTLKEDNETSLSKRRGDESDHSLTGLRYRGQKMKEKKKKNIALSPQWFQH